MTTGEILRLSALRVPEKAAAILGPQTMSYGEMDAQANRIAHLLLSLGVSKGDRVAVMSPNRPEYGSVNFGIARIGAIACHLSFRSTADDIDYVLNKVGAVACLVDADFTGVIESVQERIGTLRHVIPIDGDPAGFDSRLAGQSSVPPEVEVSPEDLMCVTFTGGTTGFPKAAMATHRARSWTTIAAAFEFGLNETDVMILPAPMFHTAGMCIWFQPGILTGATVVLQNRWDVELFLDETERFGGTAAFMVPTQLNDLIRHTSFAPDRLKTLRMVDFAAAPMPRALFEELEATLPWVTFRENYGSTEGGLMSVRKPWFNATKAGSVGRPVINNELAIVDDDGNRVAPGEAGHVVQRGGGSFAGYWDDEEQTEEVFRFGEGWVWTGDVGTLDADGFLTLVDRSKDMIISGGENIYPKELENILHRHPAVQECAVFGVPDERFGELPAAHIVLRDGHSASEEDVMNFCADHTARHKRVRLVKFVDNLPKTTVGKIQKNLIRAPYWEG